MKKRVYSVFQSAEVQKLWVLGKRQEAKVKREEKYVYLTSLGNAIDELIQKYLYQRSAGQLLEETVTLLLVSPLLAIAGFYDPPLRVRAEESVSLTVDDGEEILSGRIDVLVWLNQFWVVIVESKKTALSVWTVLPQTLAYLMANPRPEKPSFALVTNGDDLLLVKLRANVHHYALSRIFAPFISREELYRVLQILKHIGAAIK
ncbi:type I site-specific deoxyribonuclease [Microcystis aeruginosa]